MSEVPYNELKVESIIITDEFMKLKCFPFKAILKNKEPETQKKQFEMVITKPEMFWNIVWFKKIMELS